MKDKKQENGMSTEELVKFFKMTDDIEEKLQYFSKIQDEDIKMDILYSVLPSERYKLIAKLKNTEYMAAALNDLGDEKLQNKTFAFIAKQCKGNGKRVLELSTMINFKATMPKNLLTFNLNNLNDLSLDRLLAIKENVKNYSELKFKLNEVDDSRDIEYSFGEIAAIMAKVEELTADIPKDMDEANKFYTVYSRVTKMMTYDYKCIRKSDEADARLRIKRSYRWQDHKLHKEEIRRDAAGLYGGLVNGKAICAGYALILNEALQYVGMKAQYVSGYEPGKQGHAWNQVQIDGKWYNADPTWDSENIQILKKYKHMLIDDEEFEKSHGKYYAGRKHTHHKCTDKFDYSKIKDCPIEQIENGKVL